MAEVTRNRAAFNDPSEFKDNIFGERFLDNREPAWHGKGEVFTEPLSAVQAWGRVGKDLKQFRAPLKVEGHKALVEIPDWQGLFGYLPGQHAGGTPINGGTLFTYACVGKHYEEIFHAKFVERWHRATGSVIETMGLLGNGETLFVSVKLPPFDVAGDEMNPYLFGFNPLDGATAIRCKDVAVRAVCQNTCNIALREASTFDFRGVHHKGVGDQLEKWLSHVWAQQTGCLQLIQDACVALAEMKISAFAPGETLGKVCSEVYPYPDMPEKKELRERWEDACMKQGEHRRGVSVLFQDSPTRTQATAGSLWGVYQAVCEYEDYARPRRQAQSRFMGSGAERKEKAWSVCLLLV